MIWKAEMIMFHNSIYIGGLNIPFAHFVHWTSGCSTAIINIESRLKSHDNHFCRIYSHLEENDEDTIYFYTKSGLSSVIDLSRENVQLSEHNDQKETYRRYCSPYHIQFYHYHSQILEWCWCGHDRRIESALVLQTWFWYVRLLCSRIFHVNKTVSSLNSTSVYLSQIILHNITEHTAIVAVTHLNGRRLYSNLFTAQLSLTFRGLFQKIHLVVPPCTPPLQNLTAGSLNLR